MSISQADAHRIIADADIGLLVDTAKQVGEEAVTRKLTTSQIRSVFGEVRRIEMNWTVDSGQEAEDAYRDVILLQPKLAYQASRTSAAGVKMLESVLDPCIVEIRHASQTDRRAYFVRFVEFFEAILAYHRANGGRE